VEGLAGVSAPYPEAMSAGIEDSEEIRRPI
jgi:hypothetical protein